MGNETCIRQELYRDEAPFPELPGRTYEATLSGFCFFLPDSIIPFCDRQGKPEAHVKVQSFTKLASGRTIVKYESTNETSETRDVPLEFNWILKLKDETGDLERRILNGGLVHTFDKPKDPVYRDFPIGIPIELWRYPNPGEDVRAVALAKVRIAQLTIGNGTTQGTYYIIKIFNEKEREIMNQNFL